MCFSSPEGPFHRTAGHRIRFAREFQPPPSPSCLREPLTPMDSCASSSAQSISRKHSPPEHFSLELGGVLFPVADLANPNLGFLAFCWRLGYLVQSMSNILRANATLALGAIVRRTVPVVSLARENELSGRGAHDQSAGAQFACCAMQTACKARAGQPRPLVGRGGKLVAPVERQASRRGDGILSFSLPGSLGRRT